MGLLRPIIYCILFTRSAGDGNFILSIPEDGIQLSLASLSAGDTILLAPGVFAGQKNCGLNLTWDNITIQGYPGQSTIICGTGVCCFSFCDRVEAVPIDFERVFVLVIIRIDKPRKRDLMYGRSWYRGTVPN